MKLYTEEQVNKIAIQVKDYGYWNHYEITPIELPSDEEMEKEMTKWGLSDIGQRMGYRLGVKDFRNKIQGGNK